MNCKKWLGIFALLLSACVSAPTEHFYTLAKGDATQTGSNKIKQQVIAIGAISLPEQVDRPQIVTLDSQQRIIIAEQQRWASSLQEQIGRLIANGLVQQLDAFVTTYPEPQPAATDLRINLSIQRFDAQPGQEVVVEGLWSVRKTQGNQITNARIAGRAPLSENADYAAIVAAYRVALLQITQQMAEGIQGLPVK